jgi:uncharacterized protein with HEPN domain
LPSKHDPADSVADIIENAERVEGYLAGMDRPAFERDGRTRDAVERCLERICEAAHRLGKRADELMPGQPWGDIRGMGNRLRHAYDRVDLEIVWNTARDRLPALAAEAQRALAQLRGQPRGPGEPTDRSVPEPKDPDPDDSHSET